jgi:hypothetical protein
VSYLTEYMNLLKEIKHAKTYVNNLEVRAEALRTQVCESGVSKIDLRYFESAVEKGEL